jgi:hypothetical protein
VSKPSVNQPAIDRCEKIAGLIPLALIAPQALRNEHIGLNTAGVVMYQDRLSLTAPTLSSNTDLFRLEMQRRVTPTNAAQ